MPHSKDHWYDGTFYDRLIAPNQDALFAAIRRIIPGGSSVLDVGCGTGRLVLQLAPQCSRAHGIDLSPRNIRRAATNHERAGSPPSVQFHAGDIDTLPPADGAPYDFAVTTYVIHEVPEHERTALITAMAGRARFLLLGDYRVPRIPGLYNTGIGLVEWAAGREHNQGFRSFVRTGGLRGLARRMSLEIVRECGMIPRHAELLLVRGAVEPAPHITIPPC